jgi:hypothetical protein
MAFFTDQIRNKAERNDREKERKGNTKEEGDRNIKI